MYELCQNWPYGACHCLCEKHVPQVWNYVMLFVLMMPHSHSPNIIVLFSKHCQSYLCALKDWDITWTSLHSFYVRNKQNNNKTCRETGMVGKTRNRSNGERKQDSRCEATLGYTVRPWRNEQTNERTNKQNKIWGDNQCFQVPKLSFLFEPQVSPLNVHTWKGYSIFVMSQFLSL